ncbi:MAG TPA: DMT family transporter [Nitrososphaerales archaeon]|nr:DMT family transporter [Nitrososphaerales archaeon]
MPHARSYFLLVTLSIIWGLAFVAIRRADFELTPVNLTLLRWFIVSAAFLVLYPFVVKPRASFNRKDLPRLAVVGLTNVVVYHIALNTAEQSVGASLAGLLISFGPIFLVLLSMAVLHEAVGGRIWLALAIAVLGAAVISSPGLSLGTSGLLGPVLVVVAGLSNAVYTVASKPLVLRYGPIPVTAWASFVGTLMLVPLASQSLVSQAEGLSAVGWESVLYLALLSTVLTNTIYFTLVQGQAVSKLGIQLFLVPLVSAAGGVLILGESIGPVTVVGGALLLLAVGLATSSRR